jgi:hypothetical protein
VGALVRPLPDDRADPGRAGQRDVRASADREAQRRRESATAARFGVQSIPTLLVLAQGREIDRIVGVLPKAEITRRLERAVG